MTKSKIRNHDFSGKIEKKTYWFRRESNSRYVFWEAKGGLTLIANKNKSGDWEVQPDPQYSILNARIDGLIKRNEEAKKNKS